jgi:processive 1,2-diacylglycerol beta-glucosyltransferase
VRTSFYTAPSQQEARAALGVPADGFCILMIDSGWGFCPLPEIAAAVADAGIDVLAVAGRQPAAERQLRELAVARPRIRPFGFTDRVPELMAAADVVLALPGAVTCSEARVVGRELLMLDVMPGHGRDNLQHELEQGGAHVCRPTVSGITARVLALRDGAARPAVRSGPPPRWEPAYAAALRQIGVDLPAFPRPELAVGHDISSHGHAPAMTGGRTT